MSDGPRIVETSWPPSHFIREEMEERGWTLHDLACRMNGADSKEIALDHLAIKMTLACDSDPDVRMGPETSAKLARAFGVSPQFFMNLERAWLKAKGIIDV